MDDRKHRIRVLCLLAAVIFLQTFSNVQVFGETHTSNRELVKVGFFPFRTSRYQGTGLGMAITKQILDAMGGTIKVESEQGKGSRFTFTIPMQIATSEQVEQSRKAAEKIEKSIILKGKRVLLCEDHPLNAKIAMRLLEKKDMLVEHAENGKLGMEMFQELERREKSLTER